MSHKIHSNVNAKQQAYRDREKAKKRAALMTANHERGWHVNHRGQPQVVKDCPLCTVTQSQLSVTVGVAR